MISRHERHSTTLLALVHRLRPRRHEPLPLSLAQFGLTGCTLYVDPAVTDLLLGSGNQATWSLVLPNSSSLLHARLFQQAFSLDTPANAAGLTVSNAAMVIVGRR